MRRNFFCKIDHQNGALYSSSLFVLELHVYLLRLLLQSHIIQCLPYPQLAPDRIRHATNLDLQAPQTTQPVSLEAPQKEPAVSFRSICSSELEIDADFDVLNQLHYLGWEGFNKMHRALPAIVAKWRRENDGLQTTEVGEPPGQGNDGELAQLGDPLLHRLPLLVGIFNLLLEEEDVVFEEGFAESVGEGLVDVGWA